MSDPDSGPGPESPLEMPPDPVAASGQRSGQSAPGPLFVRPVPARRRPGRPALGISLPRIIEAVRRTGKVMAAARELGCSDAHLHVRFRRAGLTLREVLDATDVEAVMATIKDGGHDGEAGQGR